jgi:hypothetical protein
MSCYKGREEGGQWKTSKGKVDMGVRVGWGVGWWMQDAIESRATCGNTRNSVCRLSSLGPQYVRERKA